MVLRHLVKFILFSSFLTLGALGSVISFVGEPDPNLEIKVGNITVPVHREADVTVGDPPTVRRVFLSGVGIRYKKILFMTVPVYTAAHYIDIIPISEENPMETIGASATKAMYMTALRDITSDQMRSAFEEALDINGVDLQEPCLAGLLDELEFDLPIEATGIMVGYQSSAPDNILVEAPDRVVERHCNTISYDWWKVWFAIPVDDEMAKLKQKLIKLPSFEYY